jgi:hypothetical protein
MTTTVGDFLIGRLSEWGVTRIFGYPGDGINGVFGALSRAKGKIEFVQARHEEMAAFMGRRMPSSPVNWVSVSPPPARARRTLPPACTTRGWITCPCWPSSASRRARRWAAIDDPGVKEALGFLMTREIAHQLSFEKALHSIQPNFPQGKLPGMPEFTHVYFNLSQGEGSTRGPWNQGDDWDYVEDPKPAVDGGDGNASVALSADEDALLMGMKARTMSDPESNPITGADLGAGVQGREEA